MSQNGKGDKPRPIDRSKYEQNWERIFGRKTKNIISTPKSNNAVSGSKALGKANSK